MGVDILKINSFVNSVRNLTRKIIHIEGWLLFFITIYITLNVIFRKMFGTALQGSDEIGGYILAIMCAIGFSYALAENDHVRLQLILPKFKVKVRATINLITYFLLTYFAYFLIRYSLDIFWWSFSRGSIAPTPLQTPLWIPQGLWVLGLAWFFIVSVIFSLHILLLFIRKSYDDINIMYGLEVDAEHVPNE